MRRTSRSGLSICILEHKKCRISAIYTCRFKKNSEICTCKTSESRRKASRGRVIIN